MGICPKCGKELDYNGYCCECGFRVRIDPPAVSVLKKNLTSPLFISIIALVGVKLLLSLIPTVSYDIVGDLSFGFEPDIESALLLLGLLFLFFDAKKPQGERINPRGFTLIRTYQLVLGSICIVVLGVCALLMFVFGKDIVAVVAEVLSLELGGISAGDFKMLFYFISVLFLVIAMVFATLLFFIFRTVTKVRDIAVKGSPEAGISMVMVVFCFLCGGASLLGMFSSDGTRDLLASLISAGVSILSGIALYNLRREIKEVRNSILPRL